MTGINAALIVQAEGHILNARRELYTAMDRIRELEDRSDPPDALKLEELRCALQGEINSLEVEHYQDCLRNIAEPQGLPTGRGFAASLRDHWDPKGLPSGSGCRCALASITEGQNA